MGDVRDYELFPHKRLQQKIDFLVSPYNKGYNLERSMNFMEPESLEGKESESKGAMDCWSKISKLILTCKGDFRKSLRVLNKERYDEYETMSRTMSKIKPRRSLCRNQTYYRLQSFRNREISAARRGAILNSECSSPGAYSRDGDTQGSTKNLLGIPRNTGSNFYGDEDETPVDEKTISKVVSFMKGNF